MLELLADHWRRQGAPIAESLRPGLTENEMEELLGPLGLRLPREARMWWGWHDGASGEGSARAIGPPVAFVPLVSAVEMYEELRAVASRVA